MPETNATIGKGTIVSMSDAVDGEYVEFAEVAECGLLEESVGTVDATHYQSPDSRVEKISGEWIDTGAIPMTLNFTDDGYVMARAALGLKKYYKITLRSGANWSGIGTITKCGGGQLPNKEKIVLPCEIMPSGNWPYQTAAEASAPY